MKNKLSRTFKLAATAALATFAFTGCMNNETAADPTTDGGNVVVKQEADNMGIVLNESASASGSLAKAAVVAAETVTVIDSIDPITKEKILIRLHPDSGCGCYIREAWDTTSVGFERQRLDSIWTDSNGVKLTGLPFRPAHADTIIHKRYITRIGSLGKEINIFISSELIKTTDSGTTVFNWMGTITGTFNGVAFENTTINVVRDIVNGQIEPASSGGINMQRGAYVVSVDFTRSGSGTMATCTVTKNGVPVRTTTIDTSGNETGT